MWHWQDNPTLPASDGSERPILGVSQSRWKADSTGCLVDSCSQLNSPDCPKVFRGTRSPVSPGQQYSALSTKRLSNPALGKIRGQRSLRQGLQSHEESMRTDESRDKPPSRSSAANAAASPFSSPPSRLQSPVQSSSPVGESYLELPLRWSASSFHELSVPRSASASNPSFPGRPTADLSTSRSSLSASQARPLRLASTAERKSRVSTGPGSTIRASSLNAPKRHEPSGHIVQQTASADVNPATPLTLACVQDNYHLMGQDYRVMNGAERVQGKGSVTADSSESRPRNEDVFLNIARSDSGRRSSVGRSELRRSRYGISSQSIRPQTDGQILSPDQLRSNGYDSPLHSNDVSPSNPHSSTLPPFSSPTYPLDDYNQSRYSRVHSGSRSVIGLPQSRFSRMSSDASSLSPSSKRDRRSSLQESRGYRHSTLSTIRSSRQPSDSEATERARTDQEQSAHDETESSLSATGPSTVWNELDDLKVRIRKLELTGRLLPLSREAISSSTGERPRTAATTGTALSLSPKHGRRTSNLYADSEIPTAISQVHPLLQSALVKARDALSKEVYTALEMTVTDALKLSSILGSGIPPSGSVSVVNGYGPLDRKARRKADSVCRSLTELCLALSDEQLNKKLPPSRDGSLKAQLDETVDERVESNSIFERSETREPEAISRRSSVVARASSRLDARRATLANASTNSGQSLTQVDSKSARSPTSEAPVSRRSRLSTSSRTRNTQPGDSEGVTNLHTRAASRAMSDINTPPSRVPTRQRASHDYRSSYSASALRPQQSQVSVSTSQSQQPHLSQPHTPNNLPQSTLISRRSYIAPANYTVATSRSNIQAGSRRYGFNSSLANGSPAGSGITPRAPAPEQPAQAKIVAPSSKIATSYTPILQNRLRTNSLGARRFGAKQQPISTADDSTCILDDSID